MIELDGPRSTCNGLGRAEASATLDQPQPLTRTPEHPRGNDPTKHTPFSFNVATRSREKPTQRVGHFLVFYFLSSNLVIFVGSLSELCFSLPVSTCTRCIRAVANLFIYLQYTPETVTRRVAAASNSAFLQASLDAPLVGAVPLVVVKRGKLARVNVKVCMGISTVHLFPVVVTRVINTKRLSLVAAGRPSTYLA